SCYADIRKSRSSAAAVEQITVTSKASAKHAAGQAPLRYRLTVRGSSNNHLPEGNIRRFFGRGKTGCSAVEFSAFGLSFGTSERDARLTLRIGRFGHDGPAGASSWPRLARRFPPSAGGRGAVAVSVAIRALPDLCVGITLDCLESCSGPSRRILHSPLLEAPARPGFLSLPPPALRECAHGSLACRGLAVRPCAPCSCTPHGVRECAVFGPGKDSLVFGRDTPDVTLLSIAKSYSRRASKFFQLRAFK